MEFVAADHQEIGAQSAGVDRDLAHGLDRVAKQRRTRGMSQTRDFGNRLQGADFVIGEHQADQAGTGVDGGGKTFRLGHTLGVGPDFGGFDSGVRQLLGPHPDRSVLE